MKRSIATRIKAQETHCHLPQAENSAAAEHCLKTRNEIEVQPDSGATAWHVKQWFQGPPSAQVNWQQRHVMGWEGSKGSFREERVRAVARREGKG